MNRSELIAPLFEISGRLQKLHYRLTSWRGDLTEFMDLIEAEIHAIDATVSSLEMQTTRIEES